MYSDVLIHDLILLFFLLWMPISGKNWKSLKRCVFQLASESQAGSGSRPTDQTQGHSLSQERPQRDPKSKISCVFLLRLLFQTKSYQGGIHRVRIKRKIAIYVKYHR